MKVFESSFDNWFDHERPFGKWGFCPHRLGIEETDTGPVCVRSDCRAAMCRNCKAKAALDEDREFCSIECRAEWQAAQAEARGER